MISLKKFGIKALLAGACLALSMGVASAAEVAGVKYDETAKVAGKELQLNGLGVRTKFIVKVYTVGLYLQEKHSVPEEIFKSEAPRRVRLVMMREVTADDFGNAFMSGINNNSNTAEKSKIVTQISKFGEMFALLEGLKKGDVLDLDWVPGQGTTCYLNGKRIGEITPGIDFNNAVLKIWLGEKPADSSLKPKLLAGAAKK
jgi:hypothetical protein